MPARLMVLERNNFTRWRREFAAGGAPGRLPYGLEALESAYLLKHVNVRLPSRVRSMSNKIDYLTDRRVLPVLASVPSLRRSDACLSIFEDFGLTYSGLLRLGLRLPPLVLMSCWVPQRLLTFAHRDRELLRRLLERAEVTTVFSENQLPLLETRIGVSPKKLHVVDFGVVTDFYKPDAEWQDEDFVAAVGQDAGRDWPTFCQAAASTPRIRYKLATWPSDLAGLTVPDNVEVVGGLSAVGYRALLRRASAVVVTSHPLPYPTGQSVMLEAMACGKPVIVTKSPAISSYAKRTGAIQYDPGDWLQLSHYVTAIMADDDRRSQLGKDALAIVRRHYDSRVMWDEIRSLIEKVLT